MVRGYRVKLHWERSVETAAPRDLVYAYLSDFDKHRDWSRTLERMEKVAEGDINGIGTRYMTHERVDFPAEGGWRSRIARLSSARTLCEVRELVPGQRIVWHARPVPRVGGYADLSFDLEDGTDGGTIVLQRVFESYPRPIAFALRVGYNVTEDGIRQQLDRTLDVLKTYLDGLVVAAPIDRDALAP
jgi:uncharacterized protein YndB with AHSA1/START domain